MCDCFGCELITPSSKCDDDDGECPDKNRKQKPPTYEWYKFIFLGWSIFSFFGSVASDYKLLAYYYRYKELNFLAYSACAMRVPWLCMMAFCFYNDENTPGINNSCSQ